MPVFTVDVEKELGGEYWTNRYITNANDLATAVTQGMAIANAERSFHYDIVNFTRFRVSDVNPETDVYQVVALANAGQLAMSGAQYLPLWNVVRVDLNIQGGGRPSRKYYRLPIQEGDQTNGTLLAGIITAVSNGLAPITGVNNFLRDPQGQLIIGTAVYTKVGMRQLRRGSKRKAPVSSPPAG